MSPSKPRNLAARMGRWSADHWKTATFGWLALVRRREDRYDWRAAEAQLNAFERNAPRWLWRQWHNVQLLRGAGVPLIGFTWYSLIDQLDWGSALREAEGKVDPVGLFDLNRDPRPVGLSYRHLIDMHRDQPDYRECAALKELLS